MKKLILILCIAFASCKKEDVKPCVETIVNDQVLLNFHVYGFKNIKQGGDTIKNIDSYGVVRYFDGVDVISLCRVYLNGNLYTTNTYQYHMIAKKGDVIKFYFAGEIISDCNFVIWPDRNEQPDKMYFKPEYTFKVKNKTYGFIQGNYKVY